MGEVNDMAKKHKADAYVRLRRILIVLLVLAVFAGAGFVLTRNYVNEKVAERQKEIDAQNAELEAQYQQRLAEQNKKEEKGEDIRWPEAAQTGWDILDVSNFALTGTTRITKTRAELIAGGLMLVNRWHELPADFTTDDVVSIGRTYKDIQVDNYAVVLKTSALDALKKMFDAAKADGIEKFLIQEGYRTNEVQTTYFDTETAKWADKYTGQALIEKAKAEVNVPGTSEYQTGLSVRLRRYDKEDAEFNAVSFEQSEHMTWLLEKGWEHGFIFRFPVAGYPTADTTDKAWKTGESKKLRVIRYVGVAPAAVMHAKDLCLEEFIEYMIAHPHIAVYLDGALKYEIVRVADPGGSSVTLDAASRAADMQASIDNMGGIIIAMTY